MVSDQLCASEGALAEGEAQQAKLDCPRVEGQLHLIHTPGTGTNHLQCLESTCENEGISKHSAN
jgi:hypothetical protein